MTGPKTIVMSSKFIKPSSETPSNLKTFNLSLLDQITPDIHFNTTFFYLPPKSSDHTIPTDHLTSFVANSQQLQNSLSKTLRHFYPYAGRFRDDSTVDCNDEGIFFIEAHSNTSLTHFLQTPDLRIVEEDFLPAGVGSETNDHQSLPCPMLLIKFILFSCGSSALSLSISHKIADMVSLATFMQNLSNECLGMITSQQWPDFPTSPSLLPARDIPNVKTSAVISPKKFASIRLVFHPSSIVKLKVEISSAMNKNGKELFHPSTVEVVEALIWKCIAAARKSQTGLFRPSVMVQAVNLRSRINPAQLQNAMGNLMWMYPAMVEKESEMELVELVRKVRAVKDSLKDEATKFNSEEIAGVVQEFQRDRTEHLKDLEPSIFSSWCKFPLLEIDLGWGKPIWMTSTPKNLMTNTVILMDTKEVGGVEALVHLGEEQMKSFGVDEELLCYASVNPSVI